MIQKEKSILGVSITQIIDGRVFLLPLFDFKQYVELKRNPVTILSDNCWGGFVYNRLQLPFTSPLINMNWNIEDFVKFIVKPDYYLKTELRMVREGNIYKGICPIAALGEENDEVYIMLVHNDTFAHAKKQWERRIKRVNYNNLFVKMGLNGMVDDNTRKQYIEVYETIKYKKILIYYDNKAGVGFRTNRYVWSQTKGENVQMFDYNWWFLDNYHQDRLNK